MIYEDTCPAVFLRRPNRFEAYVDLGGEETLVHVKNTGRCRELLIPGREVILCRGKNPQRKTAYDLISVNKPGLGWVNIDSQAPNQVVKDWLETHPAPFADLTLIRPEYTFGNSRVDFYLECGERKILLEVKGCTLERENTGYFPDAPTLRGCKHLEELTGALDQGYESCIAFVIAMPEVTEVLPNRETDPAFGLALDRAVSAGVRVLKLPCRVTENTLEIIQN